MKKALISVTGLDTTGIIARVATKLYELNINILDITQTILGGYFTMMMVVDLDGAEKSFEEINRELEPVREELKMSIHMQRMDIQTLNLVCGPPLSGLMPRVSHRKLSSRASWAPCGPGPSSPSCAPAGPDTLPSRAPAQSLRTSLLLPFSWASAENSFCFTVGVLSTLLFILV